MAGPDFTWRVSICHNMPHFLRLIEQASGLVHVTLQWGLVIVLPPDVPRERRRRWWGPSIERYTLRENTLLTNYLDDPTLPPTVLGVAS